MPLIDLQEAREELGGVGATLDRQEVDDLDEQPGLAPARLAYRLDELLQAGNEAVVADP